MLAFYRKYRPKSFSDLVGQNEITQTLKNAAASDKIAHSYLFYGPRGTGKTTTARILAKVVNCQTRLENKEFHQNGEPCNNCKACEDIDRGTALDVIEIDAASNRGIDEIRTIKENIGLAPAYLTRKVFIIDETHMLTKEAFNALLKTLEEPPQHICFVLATTEREKIPATIASRTQRFQFKKLPINKISEKLKAIALKEHIGVSQEALEVIAEASEGSLRDAESLLDQIVSFEGNNIEPQDVEKILGQVGRKHITELTTHLLKNDLSQSLAYLNKLENDGYNLVQVNKDLIHYLRKILSLKLNRELINVFKNDLSSDELKKLEDHTLLVQEKNHIGLIKSLIQAYSEMRYTPFVVVPLEIAIIENLTKPPPVFS